LNPSSITSKTSKREINLPPKTRTERKEISNHQNLTHLKNGIKHDLILLLVYFLTFCDNIF